MNLICEESIKEAKPLPDFNGSDELLSTISSPTQNLTFKQLELYYKWRSKSLGSELLASLDLLCPNGQINYAGYLLADENDVSIKVVKYLGEDKADLVEVQELGHTCLVTAADRVKEKLLVENRTFSKITYLKRLERQMIDKLALREAVINAIVHTDYSFEVSPVVELFSDRITITSYGGLPKGLRFEDFIRNCSMPRNRVLMRVFKDLELVEEQGSGVSKILQAYDKSVFTIEDNFFIVSLPYAQRFM